MNKIKQLKQYPMRLASIPGCIALDAKDIGAGIDDIGEVVYFAWGSNWSLSQAMQFINAGGEAIKVNDRFYAAVINTDDAEKLLDICSILHPSLNYFNNQETKTDES